MVSVPLSTSENLARHVPLVHAQTWPRAARLRAGSAEREDAGSRDTGETERQGRPANPCPLLDTAPHLSVAGFEGLLDFHDRGRRCRHCGSGLRSPAPSSPGWNSCGTELSPWSGMRCSEPSACRWLRHNRVAVPQPGRYARSLSASGQGETIGPDNDSSKEQPRPSEVIPWRRPHATRTSPGRWAARRPEQGARELRPEGPLAPALQGLGRHPSGPRPPALPGMGVAPRQQQERLRPAEPQRPSRGLQRRPFPHRVQPGDLVPQSQRGRPQVPELPRGGVSPVLQPQRRRVPRQRGVLPRAGLRAQGGPQANPRPARAGLRPLPPSKRRSRPLRRRAAARVPRQRGRRVPRMHGAREPPGLQHPRPSRPGDRPLPRRGAIREPCPRQQAPEQRPGERGRHAQEQSRLRRAGQAPRQRPAQSLRAPGVRGRRPRQHSLLAGAP